VITPRPWVRKLEVALVREVRGQPVRLLCTPETNRERAQDLEAGVMEAWPGGPACESQLSFGDETYVHVVSSTDELA
jgi:hypothetical protein